MLKKINLLIMLVIFASCFSGCDNSQKVGMVKQLNDKNVGVITGTVADTVVLQLAKNANIVYYNKLDEAVEGLKQDKIDAVVYDEPVLKLIVAKEENLTLLNEFVSNESYAFAVKPGNKDLKKQINDVIKTIKKEDTYDEMLDRWMPESGDLGPMPKIAITQENGVLNFGTVTDRKPFAYLHNSMHMGFDIELAKRIAKSMGKDLRVINMAYNDLVPALLEGEVDFISGISKNDEEYKDMISFSETIYEGGYAVLVKKK